MIKKTLLVLMVALTVLSCQKKDETTVLQDVSFAAIELTPDVGLKSGNDVIPCKADVPTNAWIQIEGVDYYPALFTLDGKLYTQAIKLPVGTTYTVQEFLLYKETNGTPGYQSTVPADVAVYATPQTGATYAQYVTTPLTFDFSVTAFAKAQVEIQVLCFQDHLYTDFGFNWFAVTEIVVREQCFFGDICLNGAPYTPADFAGSLYGATPGVDVPAIMKIEVYRNGQPLPAPYFTFNNEAGQTGAPLCVTYPDNLSATGEVFTFKLYILVKNTIGGFEYQLYQIFTATDAGALNIAVGSDGVLDFVLGTCNYSTTDLLLSWLDAPCSKYQGFETNTFEWGTNNQGYGVVTRVPSGTGGINSSAGGYHAIFTQDVTNGTGAFTRYCGYVSVWPGTWTAEADVYLDPSWATSTGFDYSVAATGTNGNHRRDFIFHVNKDASTGKLLVGGSNNSSFAPREDLESINHYEITSAGWYTLQHVFRDNGGVLAVDLNLLSGNTVLWTETRSDASDLIPSVVGGHRYGWFTFINVAGGIAVDETDLN
jgi:hypothetical protein